jgi:uncharacterized membrane protein
VSLAGPLISYLLDWLALLVRWLHLIAGIAWIGASFYFVWLDNHLQPPVDAAQTDAGIGGELWAVHGGGFYRSQKYRVAPALLPPRLHWFYWEAYTTWLSGFFLLCLLYFWRAEAYLIDPSVADLTKPVAIGLGLAAIVGSWLIYDGLCRSALGRRAGAFAIVLAALCSALAWALCHWFSGRGAYMLFGASLGTIMVANVLFVIIPGQKEMVRAKRENRPPNPEAGLRGKQRSVHNTYFTLPVLFVMLSNHYAMTYGARHNWLVLIAMSFAGACIRAWFVARHKPSGRGPLVAALPALLGVGTLALVVVTLAPAPAVGARAPLAATAPDPDRVQAIVTQRCAPCHARVPTQAGFNAPPNGLVFESLNQVHAQAAEVIQQLSTRSMPLGNLTGMTDEERAELTRWAAAGDVSPSGATP